MSTASMNTVALYSAVPAGKEVTRSDPPLLLPNEELDTACSAAFATPPDDGRAASLAGSALYARITVPEL